MLVKSEFYKPISYLLTAAMLLGASLPSAPAGAKKKAPKLNTKKISIQIGQKRTIKVKNTSKKAKWSVKTGKKFITLSKKKKKSVVVKGKKAGKASVLAKIGKKKLTCKITVTKPDEDKKTPEFESSEFKYEGLDEQWIKDNIDTSKPVVAMSFDDGPGGYNSYVDYGTQIQEALKAAGAHATFFYIGAHIKHDEQSRQEVVNAWKAGFEVANHSYDSSGLNTAKADTIKQKIAKTDEILQEITGYKSFLFRAPNVAYSKTMFNVIEKPFIDVSIWSHDYQETVDKDKIVQNVTSILADGGIINMHSVHEKTAQAVPEILAYCKEKGFQVVSVSELFAIKGKKLMTGVKYFNAN